MVPAFRTHAKRATTTQKMPAETMGACGVEHGARPGDRTERPSGDETCAYAHGDENHHRKREGVGQETPCDSSGEGGEQPGNVRIDAGCGRSESAGRPGRDGGG